MPGQRIDGIALAAIGAGSLFVYAGIKDKSVLSAVDGIIHGRSPATATSAGATLGGTPAGGAGIPATGVGSGGFSSLLSAAGRTNWAKAFLSAIGAPQTTANINSVAAWQAREGGGGQNNPLNTTLDCCGATGSINSVGVKNYPSVAAGVQASANTITGGGYGDILMALRSGQGLCGRSWTGLSTWSGGGYSSVC